MFFISVFIFLYTIVQVYSTIHVYGYYSSEVNKYCQIIVAVEVDRSSSHPKQPSRILERESLEKDMCME